MQWEEYGKKEYISNKTMKHVRDQYRARFGLQRFAGNYSNDKSFARSNWLCKCLESREDESHILSGHCKVYGDIPLKYSNLSDDESLVCVFREVLERREQLYKQQNNPVGGD